MGLGALIQYPDYSILDTGYKISVSRIQDTRCYTGYRIKDIVQMLPQLRSLVAPGKQGPADDGKR